MRNNFNGSHMGEIAGFVLTLPVLIIFALSKHAIKGILHYMSKHKKNNQNKM